MTNRRPRIIFAGTPDFAVASLEALLAADIDIVGVFTQPDRRAGRGKSLSASPVKVKALEASLPVFQPHSFNNAEDKKLVAHLNADLMVVTAYGLILPSKVLLMPRLGCVNVHASLLPRWRGAAPIQRAIEAGDTQSGVCLMQMEKGLDTGPVIAKAALDISAHETGGSLHDRLMALSKQCLTENLAAILNGELKLQAQTNEGVTYARKLDKQESNLDWNQKALTLHNKVRAFNPWPVATIRINDTVLRVLSTKTNNEQTSSIVGHITHINESGISVQTCEGCLVLTRIQKPGGKPMATKDFLNGFALEIGQQFD